LAAVDSAWLSHARRGDASISWTAGRRRASGAHVTRPATAVAIAAVPLVERFYAEKANEHPEAKFVSKPGRGCGFEVRVLSGDEAAAALLRSLRFEKVTVVFTT
jgi:hypothetical protein